MASEEIMENFKTSNLLSSLKNCTADSSSEIKNETKSEINNGIKREIKSDPTEAEN